MAPRVSLWGEGAEGCHAGESKPVPEAGRHNSSQMSFRDDALPFLVKCWHGENAVVKSGPAATRGNKPWRRDGERQVDQAEPFLRMWG